MQSNTPTAAASRSAVYGWAKKSRSKSPTPGSGSTRRLSSRSLSLSGRKPAHGSRPSRVWDWAWRSPGGSWKCTTAGFGPKARGLGAAADQGSGAGAVEQPPAGRGNSIRILLIEDSDDVLFLMKTELEGMGHKVVTATDGQRGLEAARAHPPDLIISDIKMPVLDGYELIRAIRDA